MTTPTQAEALEAAEFLVQACHGFLAETRKLKILRAFVLAHPTTTRGLTDEQRAAAAELIAEMERYAPGAPTAPDAPPMTMTRAAQLLRIMFDIPHTPKESNHG